MSDDQKRVEHGGEETRPWTARLLTFRVLYFLLGFWCGVIAVLVTLLIISTLYGWG